jgi:hypothetical protein
MKAHAIFVACLLTVTTDAFGGDRVCPAVAPASWKIGPKSLESVRVMSYPADIAPGTDREQFATPPWEESERAGHLYQTWHMNSDGPGFKYEVDCVYADTQRYVSLDVASIRQCVARWLARRDHGVVPFSLTFSCR